MTFAIVLSGGTGSRVGAVVPKQYIEVNGMPVILYCIEKLDESEKIDQIQIVAEAEWQDRIMDWLDAFGLDAKILGFSEPGETRQGSILNALKDICDVAEDDDYVFIHDAARPLLSLDLIRETVDGIKGYAGVIPVLPMKDTVYLSKDGQSISSLLERSEVFAGQAPEVFVYGEYCKANKALEDSGEISKIKGSTEPAVLAGMKIHMIDGDERNFKITTQADLERFVEIVKQDEQ